jgi:membrane-bound metal-dependent hydrolase YbcI (DUF457 family)
MVDLTGHIAFGLLFAVPAWFLWHKRTAVAFVGLTAVASLLPDIDLWLQRFFPGEFHHHGVTHTVLFAVVAALVGGTLVALLLSRPVDEWVEGERFDRSSLFVFSTLAFLLGGLSHVFADMLSAPDISTPIEPFWPFFEKPWSVDLVWYDAWWINAGFITVMIVVHIVLTYATTPSEHRYRIRRAA